jgi:cyclic pyranopterin phosphate synthase
MGGTQTLSREELAGHILDNATTCLRIVVNKECNLRCLWCFKEGLDYGGTNPSLSEDTLKRVISNVKKIGVKKLAFTGGEPLLYPHLYNLVKHADETGLLTYVTTNGTAFGAIDFGKWKNLVNNEFHVTLNGVDREDFTSVCGEDYFNQLMNGVKLLRHNMIPHRFNSIITSEDDWPRIKKVIDFVGEYSEGMRLIGVHSSSDVKHFPQRKVADLVVEKGGKFITQSRDLANNFGYDQYEIDGTRVDIFSMVHGKECQKCEKSCGEGLRFTRISYDGDVRPCFHKSIGRLSDDSSDAEIQGILKESIRYLCELLTDVDHIDSRFF